MSDTATDESVPYYTGPLPVPANQVRAWEQAGVTEVRIRYTNSLDTLIWFADMSECNDHMDDIVGPNLLLSNLSYGVDRAATAALTDANDDTVVMWVEGDLP